MNEKQKDSPKIDKNIHPPFVALFYIIIALAFGRFAPIPFTVPTSIRNFGFVLIFIGFLFGVAALIEFRKTRTTLDPHGSAKQLVSNGIYRITRNPVYLGFLLIVVGLPLYYGSYWGIMAGPFFIVTMNRLVIEKEEAYLEKKFKGEYASYRSKTRRWL